MLHPKLRCREHGYRYVSVESDSKELYQFKCPLKDCGSGILRPDLRYERGSTGEENSDAQAQN